MNPGYPKQDENSIIKLNKQALKNLYRRNGSSLSLDWEMYWKKKSNPILFILALRYCIYELLYDYCYEM